MVGKQIHYTPTSIEIIFCLNGQPIVKDVTNNSNIVMERGEALLIPASLENYYLKGIGEIVRTFVPN